MDYTNPPEEDSYIFYYCTNPPILNDKVIGYNYRDYNTACMLLKTTLDRDRSKYYEIKYSKSKIKSLY